MVYSVSLLPWEGSSELMSDGSHHASKSRLA